MKYLIFLCLTILAISCNKEEKFAMDFTKGSAYVTINGKLIPFQVTNTKIDEFGKLSVLLHSYNELGYKRHNIGLWYIPTSLGTYELERRTIGGTLPSITYFTMGGHGDTTEDIYIPRTEPADMKGSVIVEEYEEGIRWSGSFTATFDKDMNRYIRPTPDVVIFENAIFEAFLDK